MKTTIFFLAAIFSVSCAQVPPTRFEGSGIKAEAPVGYTDTCKVHPEQEFCKP